MKYFIIVLGIVGATLAEPPVPSRRYVPNNKHLPSREYLPSTHGTVFAVPSAQYSIRSPQSTYSGHSFNQDQRMNGPPSNVYLPASYARSRNSYEDVKSEPANYNFQYGVQDSVHGNDYAHEETRQEDNAQGRYYVLLPDGRKQTVEYTADINGFKPKISYEQTNNGYSREFRGYTNGGYSNTYDYNSRNRYNNRDGSISGNGYTNGNEYNIQNDYSDGQDHVNGAYRY